MKTTEITREDIDQVAEDIERWVYADKQYNAILEQYEEQARVDPSGNKVLWIEQLIYENVRYSFIEVEFRWSEETEEDEVHHALIAYPDENGECVNDNTIFYYLENEEEIESLTENDGGDFYVVNYKKQ